MIILKLYIMKATAAMHLSSSNHSIRSKDNPQVLTSLGSGKASAMI